MHSAARGRNQTRPLAARRGSRAEGREGRRVPRRIRKVVDQNGGSRMRQVYRKKRNGRAYGSYFCWFHSARVSGYGGVAVRPGARLLRLRAGDAEHVCREGGPPLAPHRPGRQQRPGPGRRADLHQQAPRRGCSRGHRVTSTRARSPAPSTACPRCRSTRRSRNGRQPRGQSRRWRLRATARSVVHAWWHRRRTRRSCRGRPWRNSTERLNCECPGTELNRRHGDFQGVRRSPQGAKFAWFSPARKGLRRTGAGRSGRDVTAEGATG